MVHSFRFMRFSHSHVSICMQVHEKLVFDVMIYLGVILHVRMHFDEIAFLLGFSFSPNLFILV